MSIIAKYKSKIATVLLLLMSLSTIYSAPSVSREIVAHQTKKEVSENYKKEVECMAKNIYHEAGNESYEGKLAVAQVTLNRTQNANYPKDICGVVYHKTKSPTNSITCQFSWTCLTEKMVRDKYAWEESLMIARRALTEPFLHDTIAQTKALYYHAVYVNPGWNKNKVVKKIGNHIFYSQI